MQMAPRLAILHICARGDKAGVSCMAPVSGRRGSCCREPACCEPEVPATPATGRTAADSGGIGMNDVVKRVLETLAVSIFTQFGLFLSPMA